VAVAKTNKDFITDFNVADDTISLDAGLFGGIARGALNANAFYAASGAIKAYDASDRIVYNTATGDLYYDADGLGGASAIMFATLRGKPTLSAADFEVITLT
jgi:serralysin